MTTNSITRPIESKGRGRSSRHRPGGAFLEETIQDQDGLFRSFFDQAAIALAVALADGRLIKVNPALCAMLGYTENALLNCRPDRLLTSRQWRRLAKWSTEILAGGQHNTPVTLKCLHRNGKTVRVLLHLTPVTDKAGAGRYFIAQVQDIGSLMHAQSELEETRKRFQALSDATFEAVFISEKGICIDANRTASIMFDIPCQELIGIYGTDIIAPEHRSRVKKKMLSGCETPYPAIAVKKDGTRFHVMIQGKMIRIGGHAVRVTVMRDIDAQVMAEAALRENERHLRSLIESASNFVLFRLRHDPANPCRPQRILISPSIAEIVDRTKVVDFQSWVQILHPDDREPLLAACRTMVDTHRLDETVRIRDRSGNGWRWLHIISVAVPDETEDNLFFNGIILDITNEMCATAALKSREKELKQRTESLSEVNTALEVLLRKREADRLEVAEKMLANANSLILPYIEKLKASRLDDRQQLYLKLVESNLNEIISPLSRRMSRHYLTFTPMEIQVANLVKGGKSTKDIALILGVSIRTIEAIRYAIRRKLGIKKKRSNLRSHLLSIDGAENITGGNR